MTDIPTCIQCGKPHIQSMSPNRQACTGHIGPNHTSKAQGEPCTQPPIKGGNVCIRHGGRAPQIRAAAAARVARAEAEVAVEKAVRTLGLKVETTPTEALLDEVKWTAGHVAWLRQKVAELEDSPVIDDHPLVWGPAHKTTQGSVDAETGEAKSTYTSVTMQAQPSVWYQLYTAERSHLIKVCSEAIKAGVEERKVRIAEQQGDLVATVIQRILDDLELTATQLALVATVVPRHLRAIAEAAS